MIGIKEYRLDSAGQYKMSLTDMTNIPTWNGDVALNMTIYVRGKKLFRPIASFQMTWRILMSDIRPWLQKNANNSYSIIYLEDIMMTIEIEDDALIFSTIPQKGSLHSSKTVVPNSAKRLRTTLVNLFSDERVLKKLGNLEYTLKTDERILNQPPMYCGKWKNRNDVIKYFAPISPERLRKLSEEKSTLHMVLGKIINSISNEMKFGQIKILFAYKSERDMFVLFVIDNPFSNENADEKTHYHFIDMDSSARIGNSFDAGDAYDRTQLAFQLDAIDNIESREYYPYLCKFLQE